MLEFEAPTRQGGRCCVCGCELWNDSLALGYRHGGEDVVFGVCAGEFCRSLVAQVGSKAHDRLIVADMLNAANEHPLLFDKRHSPF